MKSEAKRKTGESGDAARVEPDPRLQPDLQQVLRTVGPHNYACVTAGEFALGRYSPRRGRRAFAEM